MFGISFVELLVIALIALFAVKPQDMPEIARFLGKAYAKIRRIIEGFKEDLQKSKEEMGIDEIKQEFDLGRTEEEVKEEDENEIVDIYGNVHKVKGVKQIRGDLNDKEIEEEIRKYNEINRG